MVEKKSPSTSCKMELSKEINSRKEDVSRWLCSPIDEIMRRSKEQISPDETIEEIRLRVNKPFFLRTARRDYFVKVSGKFGSPRDAYVVSKEDLLRTMERMTYSSIYAAEEDLRLGFLTLPGGHRVGITGEAIMEFGQIRTIKNVSALNIRIARQPLIQTGLLTSLLDENKILYHTLVVSAPRAGKTTMLRSLIRELSEGVPYLGLEGQNVGVVDERSEIAGMWQGTPSFDLGYRVDVLDRCPKALGINMLIRSMSPSVIAVDEIGSNSDVQALQEAIRCGVRLVATAHASSLAELRKRETLKALLDHQAFDRVVLLSRKNGPGTIEGVYEMPSGRNVFSKTGYGLMA